MASSVLCFGKFVMRCFHGTSPKRSRIGVGGTMIRSGWPALTCIVRHAPYLTQMPALEGTRLMPRNRNSQHVTTSDEQASSQTFISTCHVDTLAKTVLASHFGCRRPKPLCSAGQHSQEFDQSKAITRLCVRWRGGLALLKHVIILQTARRKQWANLPTRH